MVLCSVSHFAHFLNGYLNLAFILIDLSIIWPHCENIVLTKGIAKISTTKSDKGKKCISSFVAACSKRAVGSKRELVGLQEKYEKKVWLVDSVQVISLFNHLTLMCSGGIQGSEREAGLEKATEAGGWIVKSDDQSLSAQQSNLLITFSPAAASSELWCNKGDFFFITVMPMMKCIQRSFVF